MSKGSQRITLRIPDDLRKRFREVMGFDILADDVKKYICGHWIRQAIKQKLDHIQRSRKAVKSHMVHCYECDKDVEYNQIVAQWNDLFGRTCYRCTKCDGTKSQPSTPP